MIKCRRARAHHKATTTRHKDWRASAHFGERQIMVVVQCQIIPLPWSFTKSNLKAG